jgi:hypothetical protein
MRTAYRGGMGGLPPLALSRYVQLAKREGPAQLCGLFQSKSKIRFFGLKIAEGAH